MMNPLAPPTDPRLIKARHEHVMKYAVNVLGKPHSKFQKLANLMMQGPGTSFETWQKAEKAYVDAVKQTSGPGSQGGIEIRGAKLHEARLARIRYLAPLDVATAEARGTTVPPLVTHEEWDWLACAENAKDAKGTFVGKLTGNERQAVIDKFKKDTYGDDYEGIITADQLGRATTEVQSSRRSPRYILPTIGKFFGIRPTTKGEESLYAVSDEELENVLRYELAQSEAVTRAVDDALAKDPKLERKNLTKTAVDEALKKYDAKAKKTKKEAMVAERKTVVEEEREIASRAYKTNVTDITAGMETSLRSLNIFQQDAVQYMKARTGTDPEIEISDNTEKVNATVNAATLELEIAIANDYHHYARVYQEHVAGANEMSRYGLNVDVNRQSVSEAHEKTLKTLAENKNPDEPLTVNGIPCARVGTVTMYHLEPGFSFMGYAWGGSDRLEQYGKFFESWLVETTAANEAAFQSIPGNEGKKLTMKEMLKAYASGPHLDPGPPPVENKNWVDGAPVNALRISAFPVNGVEATLRAYAELQAIAHILGIAIVIDTSLIAQNSDSAAPAERAKIEWIKHRRLDSPAYGVPATKAVEASYKLTGLTEKEQKEKLFHALFGNDAQTPIDALSAKSLSPQAKSAFSFASEKPTQSTSTAQASPQMVAQGGEGKDASLQATPVITVPPLVPSKAPEEKNPTLTFNTGPIR